MHKPKMNVLIQYASIKQEYINLIYGNKKNAKINCSD